MSMNKWKNKNGGITLIALVITIIVLLILAGISISMLTGENGLLNKASDAKIATEIADIKEQIQTDIIGEQAGNQGNISDSVLKKILEKYGRINYEEDETIKSITTTKGNYEIAMADIWNGTTVADSTNTGVNVGDLFDSTGKEKGKLHIGDFINYSAGTWTSTDMTTIANTGVTPNNSTDIPSTSYRFGGFAVGESRDGNATPYDTSYNYVKDKDGNAITGWRLFDVSDDGVMTLISAGCPEDYYHPNATNSAYISEYILTGNVNGSADVSSLGLGSTYKARSWEMYVNEEDYDAASATVLTKAKLDAWYSKYITLGADTWTDATFQKIYKTSTNCVNNGMYESLIDNYSYYWLSSAYNSYSVYNVYPGTMHVRYDYNDALGIRVLVSLSSEVKLSEEATDTKTVVSRSNEYTYNVWNLVIE